MAIDPTHEAIISPVSDDPVVVPDTPYDPDAPILMPPSNEKTRSAFMNKMLEIESAGIKSYMTGETVLNSYAGDREDSTVVQDAESQLRNRSMQMAEDDAELVKETAKENTGDNYEQIAQTMGLADAVSSEVVAEGYQPHSQAARALGLLGASDAQINSLAGTFELNSMLDGIRDNIGYDDWGIAVGKAFIPFANTIDNMQITGDFWNAQENWNSMVRDFNTKSLEEKKVLFPEVIEMVMSQTDEVTGLGFLEDMLSMSENDAHLSPLWAALDVVDVAGVLSTGAKVGRNIGRQTRLLEKKLNPTKILKNSNRTEEADTLATAGVISDEAQMMDLTKVERADNARPFNQKAGDTFEAQEALLNEMHPRDIGDIRAPSYVAGVSSGALRNIQDVRVAELEKTRAVASQEARSNAKNLVDGSPGLADEVDQFDTRVTAIEDGVRGNVLITTEHMIGSKSRLNLEDSFARQIAEEEIENGVVEFTKLEGDNTGTTFTYNVRGEDGNMTEGTRTLNFSLNDIGSWEIEDTHVVGRFVLSNQALAARYGKLSQTVKGAQRLEHQKAKLNVQFNRLIDDAVRGLDGSGAIKKYGSDFRTSIAKLNEVLETGNLYVDSSTGTRGKVFTVNELRSGIWASKLGAKELTPTNITKTLDDKQIAAYYKLRRVYDMDYLLRNETLKDEMSFRGMRGIRVVDMTSVDADGLKINYKLNEPKTWIGKPYENARSAEMAMQEYIPSSNVKNYFDPDRGVMVELSRSTLEEAYEHGKKLVKFNGREKINGSVGEVDFILVNDNNIGKLPQRVVPQNAGYVPSYHQEGVWWIKQEVDTKVNGVLGKATKTPRYFRTKKEAKDWIDNQPPEEQERLRAVEDGQLAAFSKEQGFLVSDEANSAGVHFGARADEVPVFGEGGKPNLMPPIQALSRSMGSLSKFVSHNEWILGQKQRWINTANELLEGQAVVKEFGLGTAGIENVEVGRFLNHWAEQIQMWDGMKPASDALWENTMQSLYEGLESTRFKGSWMSPLIWNVKDTSPINVAKSVAFHNYLGYFNPVQMYVQGQGAVVPLSMNLSKDRLHLLPKILKNQNQLRLIINDPHPINLDKAAKIGQIKTDELQQMKTEYLRTGMDDGIRTSADYQAALEGGTQGTDAIRAVADSGLWPYRAGEKFTRRVAWLTAYEEMRIQKKVPKGAIDLTDDDRLWMHSRAVDLTMSMGKANAAYWQKGPLGMTTQFQQITAKTMESLLGMNGAFTGPERFKLGMGQLFAYGAAGVPLGLLGINYVSNLIGQEAVDNLDPAVVAAINGGFMDGIAFAATGVDIEAAKRGALNGGFEQWMLGMMEDDTGLFEWALGPGGNLLTGVMADIWTAIKPLTWGAPDKGIVDFSLAAAQVPASSISSLSNMHKAYLIAKHGAVYDNLNREVYSDLPLTAAFAKGMGFNLGAESYQYDHKDWERAAREMPKELANVMIKDLHTLLRKGPENVTQEEMDINSNQAAYYLSLLDDEQRIRAIRERTKVMNSSPTVGRMFKDYIKYQSQHLSDSFLSKPALMGRGMVQTKDRVFQSTVEE